MIESTQATQAGRSGIGASATGTRHLLVTGSSGLVGQALVASLPARGDKATKLVRRPPTTNELRWDPEQNRFDPSGLEVDAVVHLAGENIAEGRWTKAKMESIRSSRVKGTRLLAEGLARMERRPSVLVSASAIGYYGDRGHEVLDERATQGSGFLSEVCDQWEQATEPAREAGIRVVNLRIGIVLAKEGGALAKMLTPFRLGLGGKLGSGRQMMSWITRQDLVRVLLRAIDDERLEGPVNATSPNPISNLEFTRTLGNILHRPTIAAMPALAARVAFGRMADALLLSSARVYPQKLINREFAFEQPELEGALRSVLEIPG